MNINFFSWIREGVRQAVLHGVNDAVGHIGSSEGDEMPKRLLEAIRQNEAILAANSTTAPRAENTSSRPRKLGRSLEQIVNDKNSGESKAA
ncbi:MAG TPA: hypothetical protein VG713_08930 [Pirellulales bacterium]|nr:hypothetical protein [Pirellulales bacterium]